MYPGWTATFAEVTIGTWVVAALRASLNWTPSSEHLCLHFDPFVIRLVNAWILERPIQSTGFRRLRKTWLGCWDWCRVDWHNRTLCDEPAIHLEMQNSIFLKHLHLMHIGLCVIKGRTAIMFLYAGEHPQKLKRSRVALMCLICGWTPQVIQIGRTPLDLKQGRRH